MCQDSTLGPHKKINLLLRLYQYHLVWLQPSLSSTMSIQEQPTSVACSFKIKVASAANNVESEIITPIQVLIKPVLEKA